MLVVISPIFVADTKIIFGYNFVASLIFFFFFHIIFLYIYIETHLNILKTTTNVTSLFIT